MNMDMDKKQAKTVTTRTVQQGWKNISTPYKTAIVILAFAILWMASGVLKSSNLAKSKANEAQDQRAPNVRVATLHGKQHTPFTLVLGRTKADQAVTVRAQALGRVVDVLVNKGDTVKAGDVLMRIDPEDRPGRLAEATARLKQREIAYVAARKLRKGGYSSQLTEAQAKADLKAAKAQVVRRQQDLNNTTLTAPISGVVDTLPAKVGDYFDKAGGIVGRIINMNKIIAQAQVAEQSINHIALGKIASVQLPDGREFKGTVTYVANSSNALTRTFMVEVALDVDNGSVREGVTAEIKLPKDTQFAHRVSPSLLTLDGHGKVGVKIVNGDNKVEFHTVKIVADSKKGMWLSGLADPVRVISVGQEFVNIGQTVVPVEGEIPSTIPASAAKE